jgi:hypothetical protein
MENVKTASGAQLNNDLIEKVLDAAEQPETSHVVITAPSDTSVVLPAGYITPDGEVVKEAEVRELTGRDEEALGKAGGGAKAFGTILGRATVSIGGEPATEEVLQSLILGDRDALMLGIYKATFGAEVDLPGLCGECGEVKMVQIDLNRDVETKVLVDALEDRRFTVKGRNKEFLVTLPTGAVQKELVAAGDKSAGERNTILLQHTVLEIDGSPVIGKAQVQALGIQDRNLIAEELGKRLPGPQFEDMVLECPDCGGEVVVPFSLGALFRL